jgi:integrase
LIERDAMIVSIQFGLGCRNQEVYGLRWGNVGADTMQLLEVVSWGAIDEGKTFNSTPRQVTIPAPLMEDLAAWRELLQRHGYPAKETDFIIPGDLAGERYGVRDPRTNACHFSLNQAKKWGPKFFAPAVEKVVAQQPGLAGIAGATPYALRRGGITLRLHAEDVQVVASSCGTSLSMLSRHYSFALDSFRRRGSQPVDIVWAEARQKVFGEVSAPRLRVVS